MSKNIIPTEPCGATPKNACKTIADAVRVAESSSDANHTITLHGDKEGQLEQQSCHVVSSTISLSNNYYFTSYNGTRACITTTGSVIPAFKIATSVTFKLTKVNFKGISILIGISEKKDCSPNSSFSNVEISDVTVRDTWFVHPIKWYIRSLVDLACAVAQINNVKFVNLGDSHTKYTQTYYLFRFKDTQGVVKNLILENSIISGVLFIWSSSIVIDNVHFVNSTVHKDILQVPVVALKTDLRVSGMHFRNSNIHKVLSVYARKWKKINVHIENLSSIGNNTVDILVNHYLSGIITFKDVIFNGTAYDEAFIRGSEKSSISLENVLFEKIHPKIDDPLNYRNIIETYGDIVLNNVTIRKSEYLVGIKLGGGFVGGLANITARDVYMVGNIGYGHLSLSRFSVATMSNIYIDNTEYRDRVSYEWNSVGIGCSSESIRIKNFDLRLRSGHQACLVIGYNDCAQKFQDLANVTCPDKYHPVSMRKGFVYKYECTTCKKMEVNASTKATESSVYLTVLTFISLIFCQQAPH